MPDDEKVPRVLGGKSVAGQYEEFEELPEGVTVPKRQGWDVPQDLDDILPVTEDN